MWDPEQYLAYSDDRSRPAVDLLARIDARTPRRVVDLGCGAGTLTPLLARRWPQAAVEAVDSSPEMVESARARGVRADVGDVREWHPRPGTDVVFCNAVLHWVPGHVDLLRRWLSQLPSGASLAMQVPGNFDAPSHVESRRLAADPAWRDRLDGLLLEPDRVLPAAGYAQGLADCEAEIDAWETTYVQRMRGEDPVLEWISGSALRPVRAALSENEWNEFRAELAVRLRKAYPQCSDGTTWFPFRRVFCVAHRV